MNFEAMQSWMWDRLREEWPSYLTYHSPEHIEDVYQAALRYALAENLNDFETKILCTAVLYHDSGFLVSTDNHESHSCDLARDELPEFGYSSLDIDAICHMIEATRIPQRPTNRIAQILCDADLDYLGRDDYFVIADTLYRELLALNILSTEMEWIDVQIRFLESHEYQTESARKWRNEGKQKVLTIVKAKREELLLK